MAISQVDLGWSVWTQVSSSVYSGMETFGISGWGLLWANCPSYNLIRNVNTQKEIQSIDSN